MMTPGSRSDNERTPGQGPLEGGSADPFERAPRASDTFEVRPDVAMPSGDVRAWLHRDFDDGRDLPVDGAAEVQWASELAGDPSLSPPPKRTPWTPLQWLGLFAGIFVVVQVPILAAFLATKTGEGPQVPTCLDIGTPRMAELSPRERVALEQRCNPQATRTVETFIRADTVAEKIPEDATVVEVDQPEAVDPKPIETKYLAEVTTRTEKETRAETSVRGDKRRPAGARQKDQPVDAARKATSPEPDKAPKDIPEARPEEEPADAQGDPDKTAGKDTPPQVADIVQPQKGDVGTVEPPVMKRGAGGGGAQILARPGSEKDAIANLKAFAGDFGDNNYLPDVERGKQTVLNANSYKYADFFNGVKRAVERQWKPSEIYLRRDPNGQLYGVKDRYTVLRVELDKSGKVVSLVTVRQSGLDFMDDEAKRAFYEAQPFPNPPLGLADADGRIRFEFGFFFEITGGKYRFNWRRL